MERLIIHYSIIILLTTSKMFTQDYNKDAFLKDYSGEMIITTQVRGGRNKAILRGTEADKNREFVLKNYTGIQPSIYPAWDGGFWPKKKPSSLENFKVETAFGVVLQCRDTFCSTACPKVINV